MVVTNVVLGENLKAKAWERSRVIVSSHLLLDKLSTRIHSLSDSTPQIALMGGTNIEVKSTLQIQE